MNNESQRIKENIVDPAKLTMVKEPQKISHTGFISVLNLNSHTATHFSTSTFERFSLAGNAEVTSRVASFLQLRSAELFHVGKHTRFQVRLAHLTSRGR
jgi:hypothetical protein